MVPFGSWPIPEGHFLSSKASEEILLDHLNKVSQGQHHSSYHFDYYSIGFWADFFPGNPGVCD